MTTDASSPAAKKAGLLSGKPVSALIDEIRIHVEDKANEAMDIKFDQHLIDVGKKLLPEEQAQFQDRLTLKDIE